MLRHLHIRNFAIVDELELELGPGMSVLTGETGAGKSILLDALSLALGDRADSAAVRPGCERAEIAATFLLDAVPQAAQWLREHELDAEGECLLRRTVGSDGRSRGYVNGHPVPLQTLRELGEQLVDIHGQHAHQWLLRRDAQRQTLDRFAGHAELLARLAQSHRRWRELTEERERIARLGQERDARLELLRFQVEELANLALAPGEPAELDEEQRRLANANRLLQGTQRSVDILYEGEQGSVSDLLHRVLAELGELETVDVRLRPTAELLEAAQIQVKEAAAELRHYLDSLELDPQRLAAVEERLEAVHALARKHRVDPDALPGLLERLQAELAELERMDARRERLDAELAAAEREYLGLAEELSVGRRSAAHRLAEEVTANIRALGMPQGHFTVGVERRGEGDYTAHGLDRVEFLVSANPGQPLAPLNKVASGGELSRISLAIQVIVSGGIPTLIFDEVDVGIGGGVAEMVGRQLRRLADEAQVLCVTHQPQVAALGHRHLQVAKETVEGATAARIRYVDEGARVEEIARMLGGMRITDQTRAHAEEMLALAHAGQAGGRKVRG